MRKRGKNYEEGISAIEITSQIIGLRVIEYPRGAIRYYFSCFYVTLVVAILLVGKFVEVNDVSDDSEFLAWIISCLNCLNFIIAIGMIVFGYHNSKSFRSLKVEAAYVENELQRLGSPINCDRMFKYSLACLIVWTAYVIFACIVYSQWVMSRIPLWMTIIFIVTYYLRETIGTVILFDFMTTVIWLRLGFQQINRLLELGLPDALDDNFGGCTGSKSIDKAFAVLEHPILDLHSQMFVGDSFTVNGASSLATKACNIRKKRCYLNSIRHAHLKLCTTGKSIYSLFNFPVSMRIGLILTFITGKTFFFYMDLNYDKISLQYPSLFAMFVIEGLLEVGKLGLVCVACEYTLREINQSNELIYTLDRLEDNLELKDDILQYGLQMAASRQSLGSYGLSYMSYAFVRQCITTVTTYLVIMIQMAEAERSHRA